MKNIRGPKESEVDGASGPPHWGSILIKRGVFGGFGGEVRKGSWGGRKGNAKKEHHEKKGKNAGFGGLIGFKSKASQRREL